ncbi:ATP-binding protein [Phytoactinopolyspora limicola]|uniref:ATP-binding protein n=1 Tax=Phytoactinopolyspora limicola TaxID=2715536 RepID=UPI00140B3A7A|nr:DUF234 domain-containing protein [Phytoactinopolyspora limicola]
MVGFVGRERELRLVSQHLDWVEEGRGDQRGRALLLRGRRRVGKSRLIDVFCRRAGVPYVVHQATRGRRPDAERAAFMESVLRSSLPDREQLRGVQVGSWEAAWRQLSIALPHDVPSVVVLDEMPWLLEQDPEAEGILQTVWDRDLSAKPVLLILIGSDLAMMERLSEYGRPFHQRAVEMVLAPLTPYDVMTMTGLPPAEAIDAHLITGGLPLICQEWRAGWSREQFLAQALDDPTSPLLVSAERILAAEFPAALQSRTVLSAVGSGERTFSSIASKAGNADAPLAPGSLNPALKALARKRLIAVDAPLSTKPGDKDRRYRVADSYLRFWLYFLENGLPEVERGAGSRVVETIERGWPSWRGRAVEPLVRESLTRLLAGGEWGDVRVVGGWWPRTNNPEVDVVGADRQAPARKVCFVGSIKWREHDAFDHRDLVALVNEAQLVPGSSPETPLIGVSRSGFSAAEGLAATVEPDHLVDAWAL